MKKITALVCLLLLNIGTFAKDLNLAEGYYQYRKHSIVFECNNNAEECTDVTSVLIKGKRNNVKEVIKVGRRVSFTQAEISLIEEKSKSDFNGDILPIEDIGLPTAFGMILGGLASYYDDGIFIIPRVLVGGILGFSVDVLTLPLRVIMIAPNKVIKTSRLKKNLHNSKEKVLLKRMKVSKESFKKLKNILDLN